MRIVFWGSERGCAATSNMLILGSYLACQKGYRITMLELAEERRGIQQYFPQKREKYAADYIGTLVSRQLYYASASEVPLVELLKYLESNMDLVFMNLANRTDEEARDLMRNAHLLVVNLKQELRAVDCFYACYANLSAEIMLIIGNYYEDRTCDKEFLQKKYRIPEEQLVVIPNNPEYEMACAKGSVDRYIRRSNRPWRTAMKNHFLRAVEKAAEQICQAAHASKK